jgi:hypothetical protein
MSLMVKDEKSISCPCGLNILFYEKSKGEHPNASDVILDLNTKLDLLLAYLDAMAPKNGSGPQID